MTSFKDHWRQLLRSSPDSDILASIRETTINEYLAKHFKLDNSKYSVSVPLTKLLPRSAHHRTGHLGFV